MIRTIRKAARAIMSTVADYVAPYYVKDCHGTYQPCWTLAAAQAWLPYCSQHAAIVARYSGDGCEVISTRYTGPRSIIINV